MAKNYNLKFCIAKLIGIICFLWALNGYIFLKW